MFSVHPVASPLRRIYLIDGGRSHCTDQIDQLNLMHILYTTHTNISHDDHHSHSHALNMVTTSVWFDVRFWLQDRTEVGQHQPQKNIT